MKRREVDTENSAPKVKSRETLKDQILIIEERKTLLSYLDKLSDGEHCVEKKGILQTYDEVTKHSQEVAVQEVLFDEKEIGDVGEHQYCSNNVANPRLPTSLLSTR